MIISVDIRRERGCGFGEAVLPEILQGRPRPGKRKGLLGKNRRDTYGRSLVSLCMSVALLTLSGCGSELTALLYSLTRPSSSCAGIPSTVRDQELPSREPPITRRQKRPFRRPIQKDRRYACTAVSTKPGELGEGHEAVTIAARTPEQNPLVSASSGGELSVDP